MTNLQRMQRASFVREQPLLWLVLLYAAAFLGCAVANDVQRIWGTAGLSTLGRYVVPVVLAFPAWLGLRRWSRHVVPDPPRSLA